MGELILTDYIFMFIVITSTLFGFARGFLREVFTILNLTLATFATFFAYEYGYEFFAKHLEDEMTIQIVTVLGVFVISWVIIAVINSFVLDMLSSFRGGFLDRILGSAFGVLRGALVVISVYLATALVFSAQIKDDKLPPWLKDAGTLNYVKMQSQNFLEVAPSQYAEFYYKNKGNFLERMLSHGQRRDLNEAAAKKLVELGFDVDNVQTLSEIYTQIPKTTLSLQELTTLDNETIEIYGLELIDQYKGYVEMGEVENVIEDNRIEDLKSAFEGITPSNY